MARLREIKVTPVITAGEYASLDAVGPKLTFAGAASPYNGSGRVRKVIIIDDAEQKDTLDLFLFRSTQSVIADNAAYAITDADMQLCLGAITIPDTAYVSGSGNAIAWVDVDFPYQLATGATSLFGQLRVTGTPTFAAVDDITVILLIER